MATNTSGTTVSDVLAGVIGMAITFAIFFLPPAASNEAQAPMTPCTQESVQMEKESNTDGQ